MSVIPHGVRPAGQPQEGSMAGTDAPGVMTGKPLIESDRVEGTAVYGRNGNRIGSVKRLMIDKKTGQVAYTVLSFGGFLGLGSEEHTIPWNKLDYDTSLGGFRTDITEDQIRGAPSFYRDRDYDWSDRQRERELVIGTCPIIGACDRGGGLRRPPSHKGRRWLRNHRSHRSPAPLVGEVSRRSRRRRSAPTSVRRPNGGSLTKRGGLSEHSSSGTSPTRSSLSAKLPISPRRKVTIPTSDSAGAT